MGSSIFLVNHLDFSRSFEGDPERATPESIAKWLHRNWLGKGGGSWNYVPAMDVLALGFKAAITLDQAIAHCHRYWHPHARLENERVVKSYWNYVTSHFSRVYPRKSLAAPIGRWRDRDFYIGIRAPLIRVADKRTFAVMPIFRKRYVPQERETDLSLTVVREFCLREGYPNIDTELLRAKGIDDSVDRQLIVAVGSERKLYSADQFDHLATIYTKGAALLADAGIGLSKPNFAGYRVWNSDEPPMPGI